MASPQRGSWTWHFDRPPATMWPLVADTAPEDLRGTAFGTFNLATGIATLLASIIAGGLWDLYGPGATFAAGACFTALALVGWLALAVRRRRA